MKSLNYKKIYTGILVLMAFILPSCSKDDSFDVVGDETNRVFFNTENYTVKSYNSFVFPVIHTPTGSLGDVTASFPVRSTQAVSSDVQVTYTVDNSLIDSYNSANGTQYIKLPDGFLTIGALTLTIPQGKTTSAEPVKVSVAASKLPQLTEAGYIVPFKITSVNGNGTQISTNQNTAYMLINTKVTNLYSSPVLADMTGSTLIASRTGWTATLDAVPTSGTLANMFDARTNTNWQLNPAKAAKLTVDMASSRSNLTGIRIHTSSTANALTSAMVSTSVNGVDWVSQGTTTLSIASAYQYFKFYSPVTARYIRIDILGWRSTLLFLTEFDVYQAN
ncbi:MULTISPECIES: DUF1735 domain-containing protein [unclassified Mucilaginibacter]|uniref:BT_3987 domain-containing protein n=1 Tax=unclassified Mucilaginibacter TaxID=2617802 RepID=UPI0031F718E3